MLSTLIVAAIMNDDVAKNRQAFQNQNLFRKNKERPLDWKSYEPLTTLAPYIKTPKDRCNSRYLISLITKSLQGN